MTTIDLPPTSNQARLGTVGASPSRSRISFVLSCAWPTPAMNAKYLTISLGLLRTA